jgi:hypothetical protein
MVTAVASQLQAAVPASLMSGPQSTAAAAAIRNTALTAGSTALKTGAGAGAASALSAGTIAGTILGVLIVGVIAYGTNVTVRAYIK